MNTQGLVHGFAGCHGFFIGKNPCFRVHPCTKTTMTDIVIQAENLGKKYTIGHQTELGRDVALRGVLVNNARTFAGSLWRYREAISCFCDCVRLC